MSDFEGSVKVSGGRREAAGIACAVVTVLGFTLAVCYLNSGAGPARP